MKDTRKGSLSIFDTFKTKSQELTGEANRQRSIITILATQVNPIERTRTGISQRIAEKNGIIWKNIYSGVFRDLDEVLIPLSLVQEEGRLPLKRGPKALQEQGIPYYQLTQRGYIVSLALNEVIGREKILREIFSMEEFGEKQNHETLIKLSEIGPKFTFSLFEKYVKSYCEGKVKDLLPLKLSNFRGISNESVLILREFLEGFSKLSTTEKEKTILFLELIS